ERPGDVPSWVVGHTNGNRSVLHDVDPLRHIVNLVRRLDSKDVDSSLEAYRTPGE
ncbi:MAG: hypothetical protein ACI9CV_000742, partial [Ilumatobacter sp.]